MSLPLLLEIAIISVIDLILTFLAHYRQKAAIWDKMSSEEREAYLAANLDAGNKRFVFPIPLREKHII